MSTTYYKTKAPITSLHLREAGRYAVLTIRCNGQSVGELDLRDDEVSDVVRMFRSDPAAHIHTGAGGPTLTMESSVGDHDTLISEYGDVTSLHDLQAKYPNLIENAN